MFTRLGSKLYKWMRDSHERTINLHADTKKYSPEPYNNYNSKIKETRVRSLSGSTSTDLESRGIYFKVILGTGGVAIEVTQYIPKNDENKCTLYVIPDNAELGDEIAKIITLQSLHS